MIVAVAQRHRERSVRWVPHRDTFNPQDYSVDVLVEGRARAFVERHHYSGSFPAARFCCGLWRNRPSGSELAGVAVFSVPMNNHALPKYLGIPDATQGAELGRLVLLDSVAYNAESWFVARAMRLLRREKGIRGVISYSDPIERRTMDGHVVKRGHIGSVYQGLSAVHLGRSAARVLLIDPGGRIISPRAISKIRNEETGIDYAIRQLIQAGAEPPERFEAAPAWLDRVLPAFHRFRHPGNYVYAWGFDSAVRRHLGPPEPSKYPKIPL